MFGLGPLLWRILLTAPLLVIWFVGIVVALMTWRKHPQVSLLALAGFAIQFFQGVAVTLWYYLIASQTSFGWSPEQVGIMFNISAFVQMCLSAVAWVLILLAIFRWRYPPNRIMGRDGQYLPEGFGTEVTDITR